MPPFNPPRPPNSACQPAGVGDLPASKHLLTPSLYIGNIESYLYHLLSILMRQLFSVLFLLCCFGCDELHQPQSVGESKPLNPAAEGFDLEGSDSMAIVIADEVMNAMGGRAAWDQTRYISWTFLSGRKLLWDKQDHQVRIEMPSRNLTLLSDLRSGEGRALSEGKEIMEPDSLASLMELANGLWINDSYWLMMPFKLKDSGVTLSYVGKDTTETGGSADVLKLTFKEVGNTPNNMYKIWIGEETHLMEQWAYYPNSTDPEPSFITPWRNYQPYGDILLSGERGTRTRDGKEYPLAITGIAVMDTVENSQFTEF